MAPMVHGLEAKYAGKLDFYFIDADDPNTEQFRRTFGFFVQPEFYLLDGQGNVVKKWFGNVSQDAFEQEFASLLGE